MPLDQTAQMDLGKPIVEPDLETQGSATEAPELPKGGGDINKNDYSIVRINNG